MQALRGMLLQESCEGAFARKDMETVSSACKHCLVGAQTNEGVLCSCTAQTSVHQTRHTWPAPAEPQYLVDAH